MSVIENYLSAKAELEQFTRQLRELASLISSVGKALHDNPGRLVFTTVGPGLPLEASHSRDSVKFNANQWKTAAQIQELLAEWHLKSDAVKHAWSAVPREMKSNVAPPDGYVSTYFTPKR